MGIAFEIDSLNQGVTPDLAKRIPAILECCYKNKLDPFPLVIEEYSADEIAELAAYGGFPVRYPHFSFGQQYEEIYYQYRNGLGKIYEMVINNDPTYMYLQRNNPIVDNLTVVAHATAHSDFFKNNVMFSCTNKNMMNVMANHGTRIRKYMDMYGRRVVTDFLNCCLAIEDLIDPSLMWRKSNLKRPKKYVFESKPERIKVSRIEAKDYMYNFVNPKEYILKERERMKAEQKELEGRFPQRPERDVLLHLINYAPLKPWQQNILSMIRDETLYFRPQGMTKVMNEGWASYWDSYIMMNEGFAGDEGVFDYARHHSGVLGGKYNMGNPYKLGNSLFNDIKTRWDRGQFGKEWEACDNYEEKRKWNKHLDLGISKIFEIREHYNDYTFINEFFTKEFCHKNKFFEYKLNKQSNKYEVVSKDHKKIKKKLMNKHLNMGRPIIFLENLRHNNTEILLSHQFDGRPLDVTYARGVMKSMFGIVKRPINVKTIEVQVKVGAEGKEEVTEKGVFFRFDGNEFKTIKDEK